MSEHEGIWTEYRPTYWDGWSACTRMGDLVRCGDCEYCHEHDMRAYGGDCDQSLCHYFSMSSGAGWPVEPGGFCAWGVRRDA